MANFQLNRWDSLVQLADKHGGEYGNDMWAEERGITYLESKDTNPEASCLDLTDLFQ
jgi:hypothetical protein